MTYSEYAKKIGLEGFGLEQSLAQLKIIKTETRAAVRSLRNTIARLFGSYSESDKDKNPKLAKLVDLQDQLQSTLTTAESTQVKGLWAHYNRGRLNLPGRKYRFLPSKRVPREDKKAIYCPQLKQNLIHQALGDIISTEVYFSDMPEVEKSPDALGETLGYSMRQAFAYFCGIGFNENIYQDFSKGIKALNINLSESECFKELQRTKDLTQFVNILSAGFLSRAFTLDEFRFSTKLPCINRSDRFIEEFTKIELAVFSTRWNQLEMTVTPVVWAPSLSDYINSSSDTTYPHESEALSDETIKAIQKNNPSNPSRASIVAGAKSTRIRSFLRDPILELQRNKFKQIVSYLVDDEIGRNRAKEYWSQYGLSSAAVDQARLSILTTDDLKRLQRIFNKKKLLNQAMLCGIYRMTPEGKIAPAFKSDIQIMPSQTPTTLSIRVGVTPKDYDNKRIEPTIKPFYALRGARATAPQMDPSSHLFMGANLSRAKDKTIVLCYNEHDAVLLNDYLPKSRFVVCSLNSDLTPRIAVISQIKKSNCRNLVVIGKPNLDRRYENLLIEDNIPVEFAEILDLERRFANKKAGEKPVSLSWAPLKSDISAWIKGQLDGIDPDSAEDLKHKISASLVDLVTYQTRPPSEVSIPVYKLKPSEYAAIAKLARAREAYELCIESVGVANNEDIYKFNKAIQNLNKAIKLVSKNYQDKNISYPDNIDEFLKYCYPWVKFELPVNEEDFILFKQQHSLGLPLRRIYRGIDTGSTSNKRLNAEQTDYAELLDDSWNNSAMIEAIQKEAREAKKTDYKNRLQQMLSIAIKNGKAISTNQDSNKLQFTVKPYKPDRSYTDYTKNRANTSYNHQINASKTVFAGLAAAEVIINIKNKDNTIEQISFYAQAASIDAAEQLAAKYACIYLGSIKVKNDHDSEQKIKQVWLSTYEANRRRKLAAKKKLEKESKKIGLAPHNEVKFKDGIDGSVIGYGFRVKQ